MSKSQQILAPCYCAAEPCTCFAARRAAYDANTSGAIFLKMARSTYDYTHEVETCACGTCHKARMDSAASKAADRLEKEKRWTAYWGPKMCRNDGTQSEVEFNWSVLREKKLWWRHTFGEDY